MAQTEKGEHRLLSALAETAPHACPLARQGRAEAQATCVSLHILIVVTASPEFTEGWNKKMFVQEMSIHLKINAL